MDQIIAANYHRNSNIGLAENSKRDKVEEEILKTNDSIGKVVFQFVLLVSSRYSNCKT